MDEAKVAKQIQEYLELAPADPMSPVEIYQLETTLGIVLPEDLKAIFTVYSGGDVVGRLLSNSFRTNVPYDNVASQTIELRQSIKLPNRFIVLAEPPESLIVLETQLDAALEAPVTWLAAYDAERLVQGEPLLDADIFASFSDFFAFLIEREKTERVEQ